MKKLFIIGNGFDLSHKIPSRYEDFRLYLISLLNHETGEDYSNYDFTDSSIITLDYEKNLKNDILTILYFLSCAENGEEWNDIEKSVGELNYDDFSWLYIDESEDDKEYRANWINKDSFSPYIEVLTSITEFFSKWIQHIDINEKNKEYYKSELGSLFGEDTAFLCFNYTDTLEYIYNIRREKICYIHGNAKDAGKLYFGHGNNLTYDDYINSISNANYFSVADSYELINDNLRKPVGSIIYENLDFFESLKDVEKVYSYGFSYNLADEPYIREIIKKIPANSKWSVHSFPSKEEKQYFKNVIRKCGYKGEFEEF